MIFSQSECDLLTQVMYRKTIEHSVYCTMDAFPISFRSAMDCQLRLDVARCDAMIRIAHNDFSELPNDIETLSPHPP